jgi:iron complex outermembrane recepter protein
MNINDVALQPRSVHARKSRWLIPAAVAAAIAGTSMAPVTWSAEESELAEVTVTGSRIVRRDLEAASPIVTVGLESFENSSTTSIESVLNQLPQFVPAANQYTSVIQSGPASTPGAATLNLRGLGANRNLVLVDGRRPQPANAALVVDVNTIPQAAIQGVEVITGGASAVYGPDALAGVTNFLLKKNFEGLSIDMQTGTTEEGDGSDSRVSVLMGMNGAEGRGNIMVGLDWAKRGGVLLRDRSFFVDGWRDPGNVGGDFNQSPSYIGAGTSVPSPAAIASVLGTAVGVVGQGSEFRFNNDGTAYVTQQGFGYTGPLGQLSPTGPGGVTDRNDMMVKLTNGNLDQKYTHQFLSTPLERHSLFLKGTFEINENLSAFVQGNYSNIQVTTRNGGLSPAVTLWSANVPRDGRTLPAELNQLLDSRPNPAADWTLYQVLNYYGPLEGTNTTNLWQMMAGLNGKLPIKDWTWEAYYATGDTKTDAEVPIPSLQRYRQLIAAPNFGVNANIAGAGRGYALTCTSGLPVFQEFTPSDNCLTGIETRARQLTTLKQDVFEANMQGAAFNLPAGEARFAAGVAWRKDIFRFDPGNPVEQINDNPIGLFASNSTQGETNVKEIYGEALVPVIKNLDLELGYRFSDFNTAGGESTYKALFTWKAMEQLTFRGGYQVATRAPNTAELFAGNRLEVVPFPSVDTCSAVTLSAWGNKPGNPNRTQVQALCRAIIGNSTSGFDTQTYNTGVVFNGQLLGPGPNGFTRQTPPFFPLEIEIEKGNPDVDPETATTWTLGAVITEPFGWDHFTLTLDGYDIKVKDTIARLSATTAYNNCFNFNGTSNPTYSVSNQFCQLIGRDPITGDRAQVNSLYLNLGELKTSGIDIALAWSHDLGPGQFLANLTANYLINYEYQPDPTAPFNDATGTLDQGGQYDYRVLTTLEYRWSGFNAGMMWRYLPSVENAAKAILPTTTIEGTSSYSVFNVFGGYNFGKVQLRAGIDNLFNKDPPIVGANPSQGDTNSDQTNLSFYDGLGRRYYVGMKVSF